MLFSLPNTGTPVYFFASLLHMTTFGGTSSEDLKIGIDGVFVENDILHLSEDGFKFCGW